MSIAILGGSLKNFKLKVSNSGKTRPTSIMLKRKLFDSFQSMEGYCFIDLCSGSGSVGIEALSRGAEQVVLVEKDRKCFQILKDNTSLLRKRDEVLASSIRLAQMDCVKWLQKNLANFKKDLKYFIFLDPPYQLHNVYEKCLTELSKVFLDGILCIESDKLNGPTLESLRGKRGQELKLFEHSDSFLYLVNLNDKVEGSEK